MVPALVLVLRLGVGAASVCDQLALEEGLSPGLVAGFCQQAMAVDHDIIAKNLKQVEYKAVYDRFLRPEIVSRGRDFIARENSWLRKVESRFGVEAELITAIFLVESDLGRYSGRYRLVEVFYSLASCNQEEHLKPVYSDLKGRFKDLDYKWLRRRANKKAAWAYRQLVALLKLEDRVEINQVRGSWAGAFGICQFIPSSCLSHAVDGDGDGQVDLYNFKDAAASVANYLRRYGWRAGLDDEAREKVIWSYNHSRLYCRTILKLSRLLAEGLENE